MFIRRNTSKKCDEGKGEKGRKRKRKKGGKENGIKEK